MQFTEKRNFIDIFFLNCFQPFTLLIARAGNISCFSYFFTTVYVIYSRNFIHLMEKAKQKRSVDTHKAEKALRNRLRIRSVISENYHYITVLCPFNLLIHFKCYNTV